MESLVAATPFGRRPMTLALLKNQLETADKKTRKSVDKWKVFRSACEAREILGITQPALSVLNALLSFYPEPHLSDEFSMVVFPSNNQLAIRANGISGTTLRRHLGALVTAGLIIRKDSPNGKRYARKDRAGAIEVAFGFSLAPMLARAEELAQLAQQISAKQKALRLMKERLSLCRRDVRKLISAAMDEGASGDWGSIETHYVTLVSSIPRTPDLSDIHPIVEEMEMLKDEIINILERQLKSEKTDGNAVHIGCHIQSSNTEYLKEVEHRLEKKRDETLSPDEKREPGTLKVFPLSMVLRACPAVQEYASGGSIPDWRGFMSTAVLVRSMLGISPSAYQDACEIMGQEGAAIAIACILERGGHINSPGGYLRDLTRRARDGEFSLGPVLMALIRANNVTEKKTG